MNWVALRKALHNFVVACTGLDAQHVVWTRQKDAPRPTTDGIELKLLVVDDEGFPWVDVETVPLAFDPKIITSVSGSTFTLANHGLLTGDGPIYLQGADLPAPLLENTNYWIVRDTDDTFRLASTFVNTGGLASSSNPVTTISLTDVGSGVKTLYSSSKTLRSGQEILYVQRGIVRMTLQCFSYVNDDTGQDGAIALLRRIANRYHLPTPSAILQSANVAINSCERTRAMLGTRDAVLFEPRAWLDISISTTFSESEAGGIIGRTYITREEPEPEIVSYTENEEL